MHHKNFSKDSQVSEITAVNGVYDPGEIYISIRFVSLLNKETAQRIAGLLNNVGIYAYNEPWYKHYAGKETQRISAIPAKHAASAFDLLLQHGYITKYDRANLKGLASKIETMLHERKKLSVNLDDITIAQVDVINDFISPYLDSLFTNVTFDEAIALSKLAIRGFEFDASIGSHKADWLDIMSMNKMKDLGAKIAKNETLLEDICMSLTIISGMCSGTCGLNKTLLQLGTHLPTIPLVTEIISKTLINEIERRFSKNVYPGWDNYFNESISSSKVFYHYKKPAAQKDKLKVPKEWLDVNTNAANSSVFGNKSPAITDNQEPMNHPDNLVKLIKKRLINYISDLSSDENYHKRRVCLPGSLIINFGYSAGEKRQAALALLDVMSGDAPGYILPIYQGALNNGELSSIYKSFLKFKSVSVSEAPPSYGEVMKMKAEEKRGRIINITLPPYRTDLVDFSLNMPSVPTPRVVYSPVGFFNQVVTIKIPRVERVVSTLPAPEFNG